MKAELAIMAPIAPTSVEFQIHQVVMLFQISMERKDQATNANLDGPCSSRKKSGTKAIKISSVVGMGGHAAANKRPLATDKRKG